MPVRLWAYSVMIRGSSGTLELVELVGQPLDGDREQAGVAEDRLVGALGGGVAVERGLHVGRRASRARRGCGRRTSRRSRTAAWSQRVVAARSCRRRSVPGSLLAVAQAAADLVVQHVRQLDHQLADAERDVLARQPLLAEVAGEDDLPQQLDALDDHVAAGQQHAVEVLHAAARRATLSTIASTTPGSRLFSSLRSMCRCRGLRQWQSSTSGNSVLNAGERDGWAARHMRTAHTGATHGAAAGGTSRQIDMPCRRPPANQ